MTDPSFDAVPASSTARPRRLTAVGLVEDGILCGIVGAGIVAVWFLLLDLARGQPFFTPSLLGGVLFLGESVQDITAVNTIAVFAYTGFHGMLFLLAGGVIVWIVSGADKAKMVERLIARDPSIPAGLIPQERAVLVTDSI